jgi:hypothetical protein
MHGPSNLLSSFVTLFVTIGPIETAVIFAGLTTGIHHKERRSLALRSVAIAGLMLLPCSSSSMVSGVDFRTLSVSLDCCPQQPGANFGYGGLDGLPRAVSRAPEASISGLRL